MIGALLILRLPGVDATGISVADRLPLETPGRALPLAEGKSRTSGALAARWKRIDWHADEAGIVASAG